LTIAIAVVLILLAIAIPAWQRVQHALGGIWVALTLARAGSRFS
jgi:Tfp pilus assembly major pilin PilA